MADQSSAGSQPSVPRIDNLRFSGEVTVEIFRNGVLVKKVQKKNLVVTTGRKFFMQSIVPASPTKKVNYISLGRGATAPTASQVGLTTPITSQLVTADTAVASGAIGIWVHTWTAGEFSATGIKEAGLFTQLTSGAGTMLARVTFTSQNKNLSSVFKLTWKIASAAS